MQKKKLGVDVVLDVLKEAQAAFPASEFISSLLFQYQERGGLSKKQLEGLLSKASKVPGIAEAKLATLQAIILKKPTRYKSPVPLLATQPLSIKDIAVGEMIGAILEKYPQHKRVLFYKTKFDNDDSLSATEKAELEKFKKILLDKLAK
ncbi:MAG: hypothetical protein IPP72_06025 [Chitinophagaceae bacterium]|nr:hypothetical protein [Chitinophagaceae bacterium]